MNNKEYDDAYTKYKKILSELQSAIQLIKDIRHGNVYNDIPSVCEKWLKENNHE